MAARKHHWVPQFYLRNFIDPNHADEKLVVFDLIARKTFRCSPENVAAKRDFNRIDVDGVPIDALENALSKFESEVDLAVKACAYEKRFVSREARDLIMNLISLLLVRNPRMRESVRTFHEEVTKGILDVVLSDKQIFERQLTSAKAAGEIASHVTATFEQVKEYHELNPIKLEVLTDSHIEREFETHDRILQFVGLRGWVFMEPKDSTTIFITSDHPVSLYSKDNDQIWFGGGGRKDLEIVFPLTREITLIGKFEEPDLVKVCSREEAGEINAITLRAAERQIYASSTDFPLQS